MEDALQLEHVVKTFGPMRAVDDLQLAVRRGETCAVVGPSGAGKTTTIRMILSILFPDSGRMSVLGHASALDAKDRIGYLPEERGVYRRMNVGDFLLYIARLKGVAPEEARQRSGRLLARLGLEDVLTRRCEDMSKGMLQRIQFVASVINQPELLILDEPFSGLDPVSVRLLKQVINEERARGITLLFSTHVMSSAEELCDRVVMIHRGRKVLDEPTSALRRQFDLQRIEFESLDPAADLNALRHIAGVENVQPGADATCVLQLAPGTDPAATIRAAADLIAPARVEVARIRLEDVFIRLVTSGDGSSEGEQALRRQLQGHATEGAAA